MRSIRQNRTSFFSDFSIPNGCAVRIFSAVCIKIEFLALLDDVFQHKIFVFFLESTCPACFASVPQP